MAYALCRPPGHHATPAGYGGSCYLNNAAVAAERSSARRRGRVGIVDLDAHQGNGTAAIFYDRADVRYGSVHVDPGAGWFPHVVGYADETGTGAGAGATRNLPLARGHRRRASGWPRWPSWPTGSRRLRRAWSSRSASTPPRTTRRARSRSPPTATARPVGCSARTGRPAVVVQEGGYHLPTLGGLVAAYLDGHASAGVAQP